MALLCQPSRILKKMVGDETGRFDGPLACQPISAVYLLVALLVGLIK
jgi:hypothetical protein